MVPNFPSKSQSTLESTTHQQKAAVFHSAIYDMPIKDNPAASPRSKSSKTPSAGINMPAVTGHAYSPDLHAHRLHTAFLAILCFTWVVLNMLIPDDTQRQNIAVLFSVSVLVLTPGLAKTGLIQKYMSASSILSLALTPWVLSPHRFSGLTIGIIFVWLWYCVYVKYSELKHWQLSITVVSLFSAFVSQCISYIAAPLHLGLAFDVSTMLTLCMVAYVIFY